MTSYDAIIIGTGQAGPPLARKLAGAGLKVAIIERSRFGGTCVNTGCTPTKTLVASAYAVHTARRGADYGFAIGGDGAVTVDMKRVKARKDYVAGLSSKGVERSLRNLASATVYQGHARFLSPHEVEVGDRDPARRQHLRQCRRPRRACPRSPAWTKSTISPTARCWNVDTLPRHLLVVGGSYIGLEFGQMYRRFGSAVTIVEMGPRLVSREDADVSEAIASFLGREGVAVRTGATLPARLAARRRDRHGARLRRGRARGRRLPPAGGHRAAAQHRRSRPRARRRDGRRARLHRGRRRASHQRAGHLGAGRLQRPRRLHPYFLQRLRDRGGQLSRRRAARRAPARQRSHPRLCALHRPAARPRRHDGGGGPAQRPSRAGWPHRHGRRLARLRKG